MNARRSLTKYQGNYKYLAIPGTILKGQITKKICDRCAEKGIGLLVVNVSGMATECIIPPILIDSKSLLVYPAAWRRWKALRESKDTYRRISGRVIIERR